MLARPRSTCSRAISRRITVTPRELSHCAIPEPITPAPITAACTTFSCGAFEVPFLYLSARKKLRIKFWVDSDLPRSTIASSSIRSDSSGEIDRVLLIISQARSGAGFPRCREGASCCEPGVPGAPPSKLRFPSPNFFRASSRSLSRDATPSTKPSFLASCAE